MKNRYYDKVERRIAQSDGDIGELLEIITEDFINIYGTDQLGDIIEESTYVPAVFIGGNGDSYLALVELGNYDRINPIDITVLVKGIGLMSVDSFERYLEGFGEGLHPYTYNLNI